MKHLPLILSIILPSVTPLATSQTNEPDQAEAWFDHAIGSINIDDTDNPASSTSIPQLYNPQDYIYVNTVNPTATYRKAKSIILTGDPGKVRAMEPYSWTAASVRRYADIANLYAKTFAPEGIRVYCMPIPLASAFYTPDPIAPTPERSQYAAIQQMISDLEPSVTGINIVPILGLHAAEHIYSRTDHHWAPLGAYYAASQLAAAAQVPFLPLSDYDRHEIPGYVGTMYRLSGDPAVKNSPETFVYFTPRDIDYTTTYVTYRTSGLRVTGQSQPEQGKFFLPFKGASTYCTFMGGDSKLTKVTTSTRNGRHLLILKDSFGNALPGYLFGSFEEIHVADCRYFTPNMKTYVRQNGITDIVFANNLGHAGSQRTVDSYRKYLEQ